MATFHHTTDGKVVMIAADMALVMTIDAARELASAEEVILCSFGRDAADYRAAGSLFLAAVAQSGADQAHENLMRLTGAIDRARKAVSRKPQEVATA